MRRKSGSDANLKVVAPESACALTITVLRSGAACTALGQVTVPCTNLAPWRKEMACKIKHLAGFGIGTGVA